MGNESFGVPIELSKRLVSGLGLTTAVETGTHLGDSARALRDLVGEVWTIELSESYVREATRKHSDIDGIHFLHGDSSVLLPAVASDLSEPTLYWLDAHWCGWSTAGEDHQCPILEELAAIDRSPSATSSCLLIDDAQSFLLGPLPEFRRTDYPSFIEIVDVLRAQSQRYVTVVHDVIVAGPPATRAVIESYWHDQVLSIRSRHRYRARAKSLVMSALTPDARRRRRAAQSH